MGGYGLASTARIKLHPSGLQAHDSGAESGQGRIPNDEHFVVNRSVNNSGIQIVQVIKQAVIGKAGWDACEKHGVHIMCAPIQPTADRNEAKATALSDSQLISLLQRVKRVVIDVDLQDSPVSERSHDDSSSPVGGSSGTPHPTGEEASWFGNDFPCCADGKNCLARLKEARQ